MVEEEFPTAREAFQESPQKRAPQKTTKTMSYSLFTEESKGVPEKHLQSASLTMLKPLTVCMHGAQLSVVSNSLQPYGLQPTSSSVHGIFQARILEQVAISSSRGIFLIQGSNPCFLRLLCWRWYLYLLSCQGSPLTMWITTNCEK